MKKVLGAFLVLTLMLSFFVMPANAQNLNKSIFIDFEDFELNATLEDHFTITLGTGYCYGKVIEDPVNGSSNQVYGLYGTGGKVNTTFTYKFPSAVTEPVVISLDYLNNRANIGNSAQVHLRNGDTNIIGFDVQNNLFYQFTGATITATTVPATANTWYNVQIVFIPGVSAEILIDGVSFHKVDTAVTSVDGLYVYNRCTSNGNAKTICLDNLAINTPYDSQNFESYEINAVPEELTYTGVDEKSYVKVVRDTNNSENKALALYSVYNNAAHDVIVNYPVLVSGGKFVCESDYMVNKVTGSAASIQIYDGAKSIISLSMEEGNFCYYAGTTLNNISTVTPEANKWYHISMVVDLDVNKASIYIDNTLVADNVDIADSAIKSVRLYNRSRRNHSDYIRSLYIDNIKTSLYTGNDSVLPAVSEMKLTKEAVVSVEEAIDLSDIFYSLSGNTLSFETDKGILEGNTLKYTPASEGEEIINITVTDGAKVINKELTVNAVAGVNVAVVTEGNGTVDCESANIVKNGDTFTLTVTPETGYIVEYVKFNGSPVVAYENGAYTYKTPALTEDAVITVKFAENVETPSITNVNRAFVSKVDGMNSACVLATARENIGINTRQSFGVLISNKEVEIDEFKLANTSLVIGEGVTTPNVLGQYGINITGEEFVSGTYYARPYAVYKDTADNYTEVYGGIIEIVIE